MTIKKAGKIILIIGCVLVACAAVLIVHNLWDSKRAEQASNEVLEQLEQMDDSESSSTDTNNQVPLYKQFPDMEMPVKIIDGYGYIGVVEIPAIDIKLPVMDECDDTRLTIAPCRYKGSVYSKDIVIAGHSYLRHFRPIRQLNIGDEVIFTDMDDNRFEYTVSSVEVIEPKDVSDMIEKQENDDWDLTLFTCTYGGDSRYTVRCSLKDY